MQCTCAILSSVACLAIQYFKIKKVIEHKMCFLFSLELLSETFLILRKGYHK